MNGFTDLHVTLGDPTPPIRERLSNSWVPLISDLPSVWIGAARSPHSSPPTVATAAGWRLWANGPIFSYGDDEQRPLDRFAADLAEGRADPVSLDMHAVIFGWHEGTRRLSVWTDRMGTAHAYVGGRPGRTAVGTFLGAVSERSSRRLDWVGITGFCGFGFYPGDRTMFDDVRILRPATHTVLDERGSVVGQSRYWDWWHDPDHTRSDHDFVDEFHEIWTRTVRRQLRGTNSVVPLSGGLDSRTIFAAAAPKDEPTDSPVRTLTYGYSPGSVEIRISRRVAATRGHKALELVIGPYLLDRIAEVNDAVEGFQGLSFSRQAGVSSEISSLGDHVVGGHWGDVWFDAAGGLDHGVKDLVPIAYKKFAKRGREWLLDSLCAPNLEAPPDEVLHELLVEELNRIAPMDDADMRLKALKTEQWSFRWTLASVRAYQLATPTLMSFYANDVVDFFLRVPTKRLPGRRLQIEYLRRHHPDLARVTWQDSGMSLFELPWEPAVAFGRRALAKAVRTLRRQPAIERNWEVQYLGGDRPQRVREVLTRPDWGALGISLDLVRALADDCLLAPDAGRGYTLDTLLTLAGTLEPRR